MMRNTMGWRPTRRVAATLLLVLRPAKSQRRSLTCAELRRETDE